MTDAKCPEYSCGIVFNSWDEVMAHLQWDHNRSEHEASAMLDTTAFDPKRK